MKIAIVSMFLGQKAGGAEISSLLLAQGLGKPSFVVTTKIKAPLGVPSYDLHVDWMPDAVLMVGTPLSYWLLKRKLLAIFKNEQPDIVHIQDFSMLTPALQAARKLNIPTVMTIRDQRFNCNLFIPLEENKIPKGYTLKTYYGWLKQTLKDARGQGWLAPFVLPFFWWANKQNIKNFKKVDSLIPVSDFNKRELITSGADPQKCTTIRVPKPDWEYHVPPKKDHIRLFSAGLIVKFKGFQTMVHAMDEIVKKRKDVILHIAGDGSYMGELKALVQRLGLETYVKLLGRVDHAKLEDEFADADIVLQGSLGPESLSRIIYEGFSVGRPLIATDVGGSSELVKDGKTGYLIEPGDAKEMAKAILKLADNAGLRQNMGKAGNALMKEQTPEKVVERHIAVYKELIS